jgi:glycosyltransferase involved in cell wall biosynthesis
MADRKLEVSVLMPAYNAGEYIYESITSVLNQTYHDFELVIINDGSTDNTLDVIRSFSDRRIILITYEENKGIAAALNVGLQLAKGAYIARFDADDICFPNRIQQQVNFLNYHPDYVIVGSDAEYIVANGDPLFSFQCLGHSHEEIMKSFYFYCPFIHSSVMYRKEAVIKAGGYSLHAHSFEDYLLWTQLVEAGKLANIPEALIKVRFNPSSVTIDEKWRGENFRKLKRSIIKRGSITVKEGEKLSGIIRSQDVPKIKQGSYYALCGKKFLTDNYQPTKAREQVSKAIRVHPFRLDNYALLLASYFPEKFIRWLHQRSPNRL